MGLGLLFIIGCLLFYQSRNRRKINEKLQLLNTELDEANKAKTRFFSILNHDLRGPVANLVFFLQLQKEIQKCLTKKVSSECKIKLWLELKKSFELNGRYFTMEQKPNGKL